MELLTNTIVVAVAIGIIWLSQGITCSYFKINERIKLMEEQNELLKKLIMEYREERKANGV